MSLQDFAARIAKAKAPRVSVEWGPWEGSMRSRTAERVPRTYMAGGTDYLYRPRTGHWKRRGGQTQKFDTFGAAVGMLPAKWSARSRQVSEFLSDAISDKTPTLAALVSKEVVTDTLASDDGRFSNLWLRDQVNTVNYTLGGEYGTTTYPSPGSTQTHRYIPLWYDSGDGGISRGASEFSRRFLASGSRRFIKSGGWHYLPNFNGTPARWDGNFNGATAASQVARPSSTLNDPGAIGRPDWGRSGGGATSGSWADIDDTGTDVAGADYVSWTQNTGFGSSIGWGFDNLTNALSGSGPKTGFTIKLTMRSNITSDVAMSFNMRNVTSGVFVFADGIHSIGAINATQNHRDGYLTAADSTFRVYTITLTDAECALCDFSNQWRLDMSPAGAAGVTATTWDIAQIEVDVPGASTIVAGHLLPSGPIPPTHAGTTTTGSEVSSSSVFYAPVTPDISAGTWVKSSDGLGTNLYTMLDETTADDTDYVQTPSDKLANTFEVTLAPLGVAPVVGETVRVRFRCSQINAAAATTGLSVYLMEGATVRATFTPSMGSYFADHTFTLTDIQIAGVVDWTNMRLRFTKAATGLFNNQNKVSFATLEHVRAGAAIGGGWLGKNRHYFGVAYRFEDDSIWMPCMSRGPNDTLTGGLNLVTVNATNPEAGYQKLTRANLPIPPKGVKRLVLLRSTGIDATTESTLQLNPFSLRVIDEVDAGVTSYDDFKASDDALVLDADHLFIRYDHIMPPPARYVFGGNARVCHAYAKPVSPCAITIAPVGAAADYDLNLAETNATLYAAANAMYMQVAIASDGTGTLKLIKDASGTLTTKTITLGASTTLESVLDTINATSFAVDAQQWRAQLCPGANAQAIALTSLTPHSRAIASCVVSGQTISGPADLIKIPVGALISGTGVTTGAYVTKINTAGTLTFSGTITAATKTLTFYNELGDTPTGLGNQGYQRVLGNCLPGFLYFNNTYLGQFATEKSTVWMTVATPGSTRSAANSFRGEQVQLSNKFQAPTDPGICQGGFAVDNGFVILYAQKTAAIRNLKEQGTGIDQDFQLYVVNENRGCCAWNTIAPGSRFGAFMSPTGMVAIDLEREIDISKAIFQHAESDSNTGVGDFSYEIPQSIAATALDNDGSYATAKIERRMLWVNYRTSASTTHPNRMVAFDMSSSDQAAGIETVLRDVPLIDPLSGRLVAAPGQPWGWSKPLVRSMTCIGSVRRSDGTHLYGWNDANAGSTGDGRMDEFETSDTDNGTAISASVTTPWLQMGSEFLSAQDVTVQHDSPTGSTPMLDFHRSWSDSNTAMTLSTSSTLVTSSDLKLLPTTARAVTEACYLGFRQASGGATELRRLVLTVEQTKAYRPSA